LLAVAVTHDGDKADTNAFEADLVKAHVVLTLAAALFADPAL